MDLIHSTFRGGVGPSLDVDVLGRDDLRFGKRGPRFRCDSSDFIGISMAIPGGIVFKS